MTRSEFGELTISYGLEWAENVIFSEDRLKIMAEYDRLISEVSLLGTEMIAWKGECHIQRYKNEQLTADLDRERAAKERLLEAMNKVEWTSPDPFSYKACPWCDQLESRGHHPNCPRQAAIRAAEEQTK